MKPKSISGLLFFAKNVGQSADFYENLGFTIEKREADYAMLRINWFWLELISATSAGPEFADDTGDDSKGTGQFVYVSVENVDDYYRQLTQAGFKPSSQPRDWPWGRREFVLRDPDGYKLVFFQKK